MLLLLLLVLVLAWGSVATVNAAASKKGTFSLDFINTDLVDVFKALSTQSGVNIVLTSGVEGRTTLSLHKVTLEEALRLVSTSNGLDYAWIDVAYVIGTPEELRQMRVKDLISRAVTLQQITPEYAQNVLSQVAPDVSVSFQKGAPTVVLIGTKQGLERAQRTLEEIDVPAPPRSKLISLSRAHAEKVAELLQEAVPDATVQMGPLENSLVITADGVRMAEAESLIAAVDVVPSAAQAHTAIYEVKYANPEEIKEALATRFPELTVINAPRSNTPVIQQSSGATGVTTSLLASPQAEGGASSSSGQAIAGGGLEISRVERLVLMGAEYTVTQALELLEQLDVRSRQVKIKAIISRVNRDSLKQIGIDWGGALGLSDSFVAVNVRERGADAEGTRPLEVGGFRRDPLDFAGKLRALENDGNAKILSEPSVMTLDGRQVAFHSGDKIFFQTTVGFGISGTPILDIREIDVGITLVVTPHINPNGEITLTLAPSVSSASFRQELGTALPVVNERTAIASVLVKDGESIVIAGLVEDSESTSKTQVPILGDIPLVGKLFSHTKKQHIQDELVILVTPELVE